MSEQDSFIDEVTEAVRRDKLFAAFKKYGWIAILAVVLIVGGAAWREWQISATEASAERFGDALNAALAIEDDAAREAALADVSTEGAGQAAVLALLRSAEGDAAVLKSVAEGEGVAPVYQDLAELKLLMMNPDGLDAAARRSGFEALSNPGAPFRLIAQEQIALIDLAAGDTAGAIRIFLEIQEDSESSEGLRSRATDMIMILGGTEEG